MKLPILFYPWNSTIGRFAAFSCINFWAHFLPFDGKWRRLYASGIPAIHMNLFPQIALGAVQWWCYVSSCFPWAPILDETGERDAFRQDDLSLNTEQRTFHLWKPTRVMFFAGIGWIRNEKDLLHDLVHSPAKDGISSYNVLSSASWKNCPFMEHLVFTVLSQTDWKANHF